jgi:hypothetical protein
MGAGGTDSREEVLAGFLWENLKGRVHLEDLGVDGVLKQ